jgi:hypothetical protein
MQAKDDSASLPPPLEHEDSVQSKDFYEGFFFSFSFSFFFFLFSFSFLASCLAYLSFG